MAQTERAPRRRGGLHRFFRRLILVVCCLAVAFLAVRFGPNLYFRLFGSGNTSWISERFSEQLKEKNELVVYEATLTGQESASQNAWLLGEVQKVVVPYSFTISFTVDLSQAEVTADGSKIQVAIPAPVPGYHKLTVDEENMKKYDLLYPLTPERYAEIKLEIEQKLYDECAGKAAYLDAAWSTAVKNVESLFATVAEQSPVGKAFTVEVSQRVTPAETAAPEPEAA
ncbi:MAG: DUF4230 domain-containing protein [Eubacteriales bacterium]|nr:DUF4230 domain-containing protein [Eubacteriales bacterium]